MELKIFKVMPNTCLLILISLFLNPGKASPGTDDWRLIKNIEGIRVYHNHEKKEVIEIKAVMHTKGNVRTFYRILNDVENYSQWMHGVEDTYIVDRKNKTEFVYYMRSDLPWPARDRDIVINTKIHYHPERGVVYTKSRDMRGVVKRKRGVYRVKDLQASWRFNRTGKNRVKITYYGQIKPNVWLPEWLESVVYGKGPYETMKKIREMIEM